MQVLALRFIMFVLGSHVGCLMFCRWFCLVGGFGLIFVSLLVLVVLLGRVRLMWFGCVFVNSVVLYYFLCCLC